MNFPPTGPTLTFDTSPKNLWKAVLPQTVLVTLVRPDRFLFVSHKQFDLILVPSTLQEMVILRCLDARLGERILVNE